VGDFDAADIEAECFGGEESHPIHSFSPFLAGGGAHSPMALSPGGTSGMRKKIRNAFMLVYDRVQPTAADDGAAAPPPPPPSPTATPEAPFKAEVGQALKEQIFAENHAWWQKRTLCDEAYFAFFQDLMAAQLESDDAPDSDADDVPLEALQLAAKFTLGTLVHARDAPKLKRWASELRVLCKARPDAADWLLGALGTDPDTLRELVVELCEPSLRDPVVGLLAACVLTSARHDRGGGGGSGSGGPRERFVTALLGLLDPMAPEWAALGGTLDGLLRLLRACLGAEPSAAGKISAGGRLTFLLELIAHDRAAGHHHMPATPPRGGRDLRDAMPPPLAFDHTPAVVLELLAPLLLRFEPPLRAAGATPGWAPLLALEEADAVLVRSAAFARRVLAEMGSQVAAARLAPLLRHLCYENEAISDVLIAAIARGVELEDNMRLKPYFRAMFVLAAVNDSQAQARVRSGVQRIVETMEGQQRFVPATEVATDMLLRLARRSRHCRAWFAENRPRAE